MIKTLLRMFSVALLVGCGENREPLSATRVEDSVERAVKAEAVPIARGQPSSETPANPTSESGHVSSTTTKLPVPTESDRPLSQRWLHAMSRGDAARVSELCNNLQVRSTGKTRKCDGRAEGVEATRELVHCLVTKEKLLVESAQLATQDTWSTVRVPCAKASRPLQKLSKGTGWECLLLQGDGLSYDVALQIAEIEGTEKIAQIAYNLEFSGPG